jgi:hypothetical protein
VPQAVWAQWHVPAAHDVDALTQLPKPWFCFQTAWVTDAELAQQYGRQYPWEYYAQTTPRQRLALRYVRLAQQKREVLFRDYYERQHRERR